jgi:hypothetical protein
MTIWFMRIACWITKGTNLGYCFPTATMVARALLNVNVTRILPVLLQIVRTGAWAQRTSAGTSYGPVVRGVQCGSKLAPQQMQIIFMSLMWCTLHFGGRLRINFRRPVTKAIDTVKLFCFSYTCCNRSVKEDKETWINTLVPRNAMVTPIAHSPNHAPSYFYHCLFRLGSVALPIQDYHILDKETFGNSWARRTYPTAPHAVSLEINVRVPQIKLFRCSNQMDICIPLLVHVC